MYKRQTEKRHLIGMVDVKDLLTAGESRTIEEIMDENVLSVSYTHLLCLSRRDMRIFVIKYGISMRQRRYVWRG